MNKSTTILVVGSDKSSDDAGSTKMKKAKKDNIHIWTEEMFIDFCKTNE
jgi:NAD-dependent DNA ligase